MIIRLTQLCWSCNLGWVLQNLRVLTFFDWFIFTFIFGWMAGGNDGELWIKSPGPNSQPTAGDTCALSEARFGTKQLLLTVLPCVTHKGSTSSCRRRCSSSSTEPFPECAGKAKTHFRMKVTGWSSKMKSDLKRLFLCTCIILVHVQCTSHRLAKLFLW